MFAPLSVGSANYEERIVRADGAWTTLHRHAAPAALDAPRWKPALHPSVPAVAVPRDGVLTRRTILFEGLPEGGDAVRGRLPLLVNAHVTVCALRADSASETVTFTDHDGDQLVCVLEGGATLDTPCGTLRANPAEHLWIPRAMPHRWRVDKLGLRAMVVELRGEFAVSPRWRNGYGQLAPDAPFRLRDLHRPNWFLRPHAAPDGVACAMRRGGEAWEATVTVDPLATTGWDGAVYPVTLAWEVPLERARDVELLTSERVMVRTRIISEKTPPLPGHGDLVTLSLDGDGAASLHWEPVGVAPAVHGTLGGIVVQVVARDPLSLTANGALLVAP